MGAFGSFVNPQSEKKPGLSSVRGESRFKGLMGKTSTEDFEKGAKEKPSFGSLGKVNSILVEGFHALLVDDRHTGLILGVSFVLGRIFGRYRVPVCCQGHKSANAFERALQTWVTEDFVGDLKGKTSTCRAADCVELGRITLERGCIGVCLVNRQSFRSHQYEGLIGTHL